MNVCEKREVNKNIKMINSSENQETECNFMNLCDDN